ncbi:MAG: arsenite methyltransferase [Candidatus Helarchaeota archaeon]|nr:arsenite methyltransferase [Candidatus Helarchaeota archaeon]
MQDPEKIKDYVKKRYASLISQPKTSCCGPSVTPVDTSTFHIELEDKRKFAEKLGYTEVELKDLPDDVTDISFGCGNPTAIAELKPGEVVLDLGSGGGIDVFLAAKKVGPTGKVIGLDMTPAMIERANTNAEKVGLQNVEFKLGEMESIPLIDDSIDVVISNCVINLSPDKAKVFRQIFRVLRPGGRIAVSDIVLNGKLPEFIKRDFEAWAGCVAGALQEGDYLQKIKDAGFTEVKVESKRSVKELTYSIKQNPEILQQLDKEISVSPEELLGRIVSIKVKAYKPK